MAEGAIGVQQQLQVLLACHVKSPRHLAAALCDLQILGSLQQQQDVRLTALLACSAMFSTEPLRMQNSMHIFSDKCLAHIVC